MARRKLLFEPENLAFVPWWGRTHSGVGSEIEYMQAVVAALQRVYASS